MVWQYLIIFILSCLEVRKLSEIGAKKEVFFDKYCNKCEYKKTPESAKPCFSCLSEPFNIDSHKPVQFMCHKNARRNASQSGLKST